MLLAERVAQSHRFSGPRFEVVQST